MEMSMSMSHVSMIVRWLVPIGESRSIADALHRAVIEARAHHGCLRCLVSTDVGRQAGVEYVEEWASEELLRTAIRSERFSRVAALMERATSQPHIEFMLPAGTRGLDYVAEVRRLADR